MEPKILNITKKVTSNEILDNSLSIIDRLNTKKPVLEGKMGNKQFKPK